MANYQVHGVNVDHYKNRQFSGDNRYNWYDWKTKEVHRLRILPPWSGSGWDAGLWAHVIHEYRNFPPDLTRKVYDVKSTFPMLDLPCPMTERVEQLRAAGITEPAFDIWRTPYCNAVDMDFKADVGPVVCILRLPMSVYNWLNERILDPEYGPMILHPEKGLNIKVVYDQKNPDNRKKYQVQFLLKVYDNSPDWRLGPGPIHPDPSVVERVMNSMYDIGKIWAPPTEEVAEQNAMYASAFYQYHLQQAAGAMATRAESAGKDQAAAASALASTAAPQAQAAPAAPQPSSLPPCVGNRMEDLFKCMVCPHSSVCGEHTAAKLAAGGEIDKSVHEGEPDLKK